MTTLTETITPQRRQQLHRRTLTTVLISQSFGGAGLAAGISVGALIAQDMLGSDALSGLPTALFTLGAALTAFIVGRAAQRSGRRKALGFGFIIGGIGAIGVVAACQPGLLFISLFLYGAGTATNMQARYAGTDLAPANRKGTAVSTAMVATTIGAVAGPNLIEPLGGLAEGFGLPTLAGPFLLAAVAYITAGVILVTMLRPDPYLVAKQLEAQESPQADTITAKTPVEKPSRLFGWRVSAGHLADRYGRDYDDDAGAHARSRSFHGRDWAGHWSPRRGHVAPLACHRTAGR